MGPFSYLEVTAVLLRCMMAFEQACWAKSLCGLFSDNRLRGALTSHPVARVFHDPCRSGKGERPLSASQIEGHAKKLRGVD